MDKDKKILFDEVPYFIASHITVHRQPQCGVYLLILFLSFVDYRFGDGQPPETTCIEAADSLANVGNL